MLVAAVAAAAAAVATACVVLRIVRLRPRVAAAAAVIADGLQLSAIKRRRNFVCWQRSPLSAALDDHIYHRFASALAV